jgi:hypothetical protein
MKDTTEDTSYREIGRGCCGSIWALPNSDWVIKREDISPYRSVLNDQIMHRRVIAANNVDEHKLPVRIPTSYEIIEAEDDWWNTNLDLFPNSEACRSYRQERIPAVPLSIRSMLITKYCRESLQASTRASKKNEDCLIRLYTGKRRQQRTPGLFFNLRNYGLHVDQMEELGLDIITIARALADALAHCYWKARVDANDVEFVLAPDTTEPHASDTAKPHIPVFNLLDTNLVIWMLDYDCVRPLPLSSSGITQAVQAFWRNDAYFPRPFGFGHTDADCKLWSVFKTRFLNRSVQILKQDGVGEVELGLPKLWVEYVEAEGARRAALGTTTD